MKDTCFILTETGIWDSPCYVECASDSSDSCDHGPCPLEFEGTCDRCIFKAGYKKCGECRANERTARYAHTGYYWMCDACIEKFEIEAWLVIS